MSISNRKPGEKKESPAEPLKRSVAGTMRAIARRRPGDHLRVDRPALMGDKARLPEPPRKLTAGDVAVLRGHADSMALRMACHDAATHRRLAPEGQAARAIYDAVEQARVESIGSRRMAGMARTSAPCSEDRYHRGGKYEEITDRADAPIETPSRSWCASASRASSLRRRSPRSWSCGASIIEATARPRSSTAV
jgi:cobaltochelatase CobT